MTGRVWALAGLGALAATAVAWPASSAPPPVPASPSSEPPEAAPSSAPPIVPPKLVGSTEVPYPEGGQGTERVVVELVVDRDGHGTSARVVAGREPFASAALEHAPKLVFEPARRGEVPVVARIRLELTFHEPPPAAVPPSAASAEGDPAAAPSASAPSTAPETNRAEHVTVRGRKSAEDGRTSLSRVEVRQLPGAFGDPFRAVDVLPSVTPVVSGLPYYYFRGAPPAATGYFLDGIRVPYVYHLAIGPSVLYPSLIDGVDLYTGIAPVQYGRYFGGVLVGRLTEPADEMRAELSLRAVDAGALVEAPLLGGRARALAGFRYSYTGLLVSVFAKDTRLDYRDAQLRFVYDVTPRDRLSLFAFGAFDLLQTREEDVAPFNTRFGVEFYRARIKHEHVWTGGARLASSVTLGWDRSFLAPGRIARLVGVTMDSIVEAPLSKSTYLRAGISGSVDTYGTTFSGQFDPKDPATRDLITTFGARTDGVVGAFVEAPVDVSPTFRMTPGLRADLYTSFGVTAVAVDPRLTAQVAVSRTVRLLEGFGLATQLPAFALPIPGLQPGAIVGGFQRAVQSQLGVEVDLPLGFTTRLMAFHHAYLDIVDAFPAPDDVNLSLDVDRLRNRVPGQAYGLELLLRRDFAKRVSGILSYTLARSERVVSTGRTTSGFDRPHTLNVALSYDLGHGWRAGARFAYYTGAPRAPVAAPPPGLGPGAAIGVEPCSRARLPDFARLDARLEKTWRLGRTSTLSLVLEGLNVTGTKEVVAQNDALDRAALSPCEDTAIGPVSVPNVSLEGRF